MRAATTPLIAALLVLSSSCTQMVLGEIEFFGYKGYDTEGIRSAMPFREGESFPRTRSPEQLKHLIAEKVRAVIGQEPTSVSFVCCDSKQRSMIYIGLPGASFQPAPFNPAPSGDVRLPPPILRLNDEFDNAMAKAALAGHASEENSQGYALPIDPAWRKAALAIREYALQNAALVLQVLASSSDASQRATAARALGYGRQSDDQVDALVHASLDPDDSVRNNATRALWVLADARPEVAQTIPASPFIGLLKSGEWSDHNKASLLVTELTKSRDPKVLALLRAEALDALIEMARWRGDGHAEATRLLLGRIAGIEEDRLNKLVDAGQLDAILNYYCPN